MTTPGGRALDAAITMWGGIVAEPTARQRNGAGFIDEYIRSPGGLGWPSAALKPGDTRDYTRNGQFQWCGAFAAMCWHFAGLDAGVRHRRFASTYRLASTEDAHGPPIPRVPLGQLQPGDILVVGHPKGHPSHRRYGEHIAVVQAVHDGLIHTVEGNARGLLGDRRVGEGVVIRTRPFAPTAVACPVSGLSQAMVAMLAYRPGPTMLAGVAR